jgi:hypothetical protein
MKRIPTCKLSDMWSVWEESDLFLVTTNGSLKRNGALVMGRGIAQEALDRFPGLDLVLGKAIGRSGREYGLLVSPRWPAAKLGAFQVKLRYWEDADLELIRLSTEMLLAWLKEHPDQRADLNFPGIGCGRLSLDVVRPIIEVLPSSVHIWQKGVEARNG